MISPKKNAVSVSVIVLLSIIAASTYNSTFVPITICSCQKIGFSELESKDTIFFVKNIFRSRFYIICRTISSIGDFNGGGIITKARGWIWIDGWFGQRNISFVGNSHGFFNLARLIPTTHSQANSTDYQNLFSYIYVGSRIVCAFGVWFFAGIFGLSLHDNLLKNTKSLFVVVSSSRRDRTEALSLLLYIRHASVAYHTRLPFYDNQLAARGVVPPQA